MKIKVGVSARHIHITKEVLHLLFGDDYELTKKKDLKQPLQFASKETLTIQTEKGFIDNVRILGPIRDYSQVEISKTDAIKLGINPPIRNSGDIKGSAPITLIGPKGKVDLKEGCIIANRHIHIAPPDIKKYHLVGKKTVRALVLGEKGGILENIHIRCIEPSCFELHLDTDDANAHLISQGDVVEILDILDGK